MKYLAIVHVKKDYEQIAYEDEPTAIVSEYHYELRIIIENKKHILLLEFNSYKKALEQSKIIAKGLEVELMK